jgi:hypothetical protein
MTDKPRKRKPRSARLPPSLVRRCRVAEDDTGTVIDLPDHPAGALLIVRDWCEAHPRRFHAWASKVAPFAHIEKPCGCETCGGKWGRA